MTAIRPGYSLWTRYDLQVTAKGNDILGHLSHVPHVNFEVLDTLQNVNFSELYYHPAREVLAVRTWIKVKILSSRDQGLCSDAEPMNIGE